MRNILTAVFAAGILLGTIPLSSCGTGEPRQPDSSAQSSASGIHNAPVSVPETTESALKPPAVPLKDSERLSYTIGGVYSQGKYYTVTVSGKKRSDKAADTLCIDGTHYGDLKMELLSGDQVIDSLELEIPKGERLLILESAARDLSYGCTLISSKRDFSADEYPDLIQLDLYNNDEIEVPQYGRFFAVFDEKLLELPIYENGARAEPRGTHFSLKSAGVMTHCLCVSTASRRYTVRKYKYTFNLTERRLDKENVRFYGWGND